MSGQEAIERLEAIDIIERVRDHYPNERVRRIARKALSEGWARLSYNQKEMLLRAMSKVLGEWPD